MTTRQKNIITPIILAILVLGLSVLHWVGGETAYSDSERRALASFPEFNEDTVFSGEFMSDFETYRQDQFPLRDRFRSLKSAVSLGLFRQKDNNGIYFADGHVSKIEYPLNEKMLDHAADRFRFLYDSFLAGTDAKLYFSIIPDKNYFLADQNGYLGLDYNRLTAYMKEKTEYMEYIEIFDLLSAEDYYLTDTHWRQEKIYDVAARLAERMGTTLTGEYREEILEHPFYGVYCGQAALPLKPDTIRYLTSDILESCTVKSYADGMPTEGVIYNYEKATGKDGYDFFLSGADPLIVIENPNAKTDRELILFRDSYGSSIAPLLVEGYAKVTLVDIRYIQSGLLGGFLDITDQDVLFLYGTILLNSSLGLK